MFEKLRQLCKRENCDMSKFWENNEKPEGTYKQIFMELKQSIEWKCTHKDLLKRIRKIGRCTKFTARETKLLRKLINQQMRESEVNFDQVMFYFPGKTAEMLENQYYNKPSF